MLLFVVQKAKGRGPASAAFNRMDEEEESGKELAYFILYLYPSVWPTDARRRHRSTVPNDPFTDYEVMRIGVLDAGRVSPTSAR